MSLFTFTSAGQITTTDL